MRISDKTSEQRIFYTGQSTTELRGRRSLESKALTVLDSQASAAQELVPLLASILELPTNIHVRAAHEAVVALDNLAKQVDSLIDAVPIEPGTDGYCLEDFDRLQAAIIGCFNHFPKSLELQKLIGETIRSVALSFKFNTVERQEVYHLDNTEANGCTMFYLLPLFNYILALAQHSPNPRFFVLFANYVQMLDDFVDVFEDEAIGIATPVSMRLSRLNGTIGRHLAFRTLSTQVLSGLRKHLICIRTELADLNLEIEILTEWDRFHSRLGEISLPNAGDHASEIRYLRRIKKLTPTMLCYS
jgi:hypothetical protein